MTEGGIEVGKGRMVRHRRALVTSQQANGAIPPNSRPEKEFPLFGIFPPEKLVRGKVAGL
jgi:hypothetical protein